MELTLGFVTDIHFGPAARFEGKLRKLSARAPELLEKFVARMNHEVRPDVIVNLGDDLEDERRDLDLARYRDVVGILRTADARLVNVAGNHDTVHLSERDLRDVWRDPDLRGDATLYGARDIGGFHVVTLHSHEVKDQRVFVDDAQLGWLERDLALTALPTLVFVHHSPADQVLIGNRWFEGRPHLCLVHERKRLRGILEASRKVILVMNGHLHWNHLDMHRGIPYVTLQSLIENLDEDAPGRPARAHAVVRIDRSRVLVEIDGEERARYQFHRG